MGENVSRNIEVEGAFDCIDNPYTWGFDSRNNSYGIPL